MSGYIDLKEHFSSVVAKDVSSLLLGRSLGYGSSRAIFEHATDPGLIVKIEDGAGSFHNIAEWQVWNSVKHTTLARWFAPVVHIASAGSVLVMKKCDELRTEELPAEVPAFFTDLKPENWGRYEGRAVCLDYGLHLLHERGMTKRMRKVDWS